MKDMPNRALIVIGAALALGIGGGIAVAQIPSSDGTITACMTPPAGTIRLVDAESGATCKKGEKKVTWNEAGQPGADGVSGYEVVQEQGTENSFPASNDTIAYTKAVECPAGKKMLGWFAHSSSNRGIVDAADSGLFITGAGLDQVTVSFSKGNGEPFREGDVSFWRIQVTCADVS